MSTETIPAVTIHIPTPLRAFTGQAASVTAQGATVGAALANLVDQHSGLKQHLYDDAGSLRSFVNIYVNDDDIRYLQQSDTPLKSTDEISIIPSIAGGYV